VKSWIRIRISIKVKTQELQRIKMKLWRALVLTMDAWRLRMEPWRVCRPVAADSHSMDEEQVPDPDPDPYQM
jgi:hypothetical protein